MFAWVAVQIRRLPWWGQVFAWPLYGWAWVVSSILGWVVKELGTSAKHGAEKAFAPLLWPIVAILGVAAIYLIAGPQALGAIMGPALVLGLAMLALRVAVFSPAKPKKKKKAH